MSLLRFHVALAAVLAVGAAALCWSLGARSVGGADSYGYASQADAWLSGDRLVRDPFIDANHPPFSRWAIAPLGWRPEVGGYGIVPTYSPGYPLMMAAAKRLCGHAAMFAVVPLCAGLLVLSGYALGRRLGVPGAGLLAALFIATSPTVLNMSMLPMSDVPSAALWSGVVVLALGSRARSSFAAGVVAALAILVRPNLLPIAAISTIWLLVRDVREFGPRQLARWRVAWFALPAAVGAVVNARINADLYGSPWASGYGPLSQFFAWRHIPPNLGHYAGFLSSAETIFAFVALVVAIGAPVFFRWSVRARQAAWLLAPTVIAVVVTYLAYLEFDDWWYLRFMLPIWPALAIAGATTLIAIWHRHRIWGRAVAVVSTLFVIGHGLVFAQQHGAFTIGRTESRYPQVARAVASETEPTAAIISMQQSGSMEYYGGRVIVRWDVLGVNEFDSAIAWLIDHGHTPYLLLDRFEVDRIRARYGGSSAIARLEWSPKLSFFNGETLLFDLADRNRHIVTTELGVYTERTPLPVPWPHW